MSSTNPHESQVNNQPTRSLQKVLLAATLLQVFATAGVISFLFLWGQSKTTDELIQQLQVETSQRIESELDQFLNRPKSLLNQSWTVVQNSYLDINKVPQTAQFLWNQCRVHNIDHIFLGYETGNYIGAGQGFQERQVTLHLRKPQSAKGNVFGWKTNGRGEPLEVFQDYGPLNPRTTVWYQRATQAGKGIWSPVYRHFSQPNPLAIAYSRPIYGSDNSLFGVIAVELRLARISQLLEQLSPAGHAFILDQQGYVIASSREELLQPADQPQLLLAKKIQDPLIRTIAEQLDQSAERSRPIKLSAKGEKQYIQVLPWQGGAGLNWELVVAIPESDLKAIIHARRQQTLLFCIGALGLAALMSIYISYEITRPVQEVSELSEAIAAGDLSQDMGHSAILEVHTIKESLNTIVQQLQTALQQQSQIRWELNNRIRLHSAELSQAKASAESLNRELLHLTQIDDLTQVGNRRNFRANLEKEWKRSLRNGSYLAIILLDIDYFKSYNDTYGHPAGDVCLFRVAQTVKRILKRSTDSISRYGGEEFAVILPETPPRGALEVAERIRHSVLQLCIPHRQSSVSNFVTVSLGVTARRPSVQLQPDTLIQAADEALYRAKSLGRNHSHLSAPNRT